MNKIIERLKYCLEDSMYNEEDVINDLSEKFSKEHVEKLLFEDVIKSSIFEGCVIDAFNHKENRILFINSVSEFFDNNEVAIKIANEQFDIWEKQWESF